MSREYTKEEVRDRFLNKLRFLTHYWATTPGAGDIKDRCEGVSFSILNILDGTSSELPAFDLVVKPHPDDRQFHIKEGEDYYPSDIAINNDCQLHELFYK